ncbi:MAG: hypothetical protein RI924_1004, partial [Bacteroidota bacterium]
MKNMKPLLALLVCLFCMETGKAQGISVN